MEIRARSDDECYVSLSPCGHSGDNNIVMINRKINGYNQIFPQITEKTLAISVENVDHLLHLR